jgi:hypothetical protein
MFTISMKKHKARAVRVQGRASVVRCPQLRGAFMAVKRAPRLWRWVLLGAGACLLGGGLWWVLGQGVGGSEYSGNMIDSGVGAQTAINRHPYTGVPQDLPLPAPRVAGVMVENSADAWPLSGVEEAFLVIEAPAEADIPRFLAFYSEDQNPVAKIGPVRSARAYYVDWASDYGALYAHVGGSPEALAIIRAGESVVDLDQFFESEYFWRSNDRYAPHNVYTSTDLLWAGADEQGLLAPGGLAEGLFREGEYYPESPTQEAKVNWTDGVTYDFSWRLLENGLYGRVSLAGSDYQAANVIFVETDMSVVDDKGRKDLRTTGTGSALILRAGEAVSAVWTRAESGGWQFKRVDNQQPVDLVPGKTWIEVLPDGLESIEIVN